MSHLPTWPLWVAALIIAALLCARIAGFNRLDDDEDDIDAHLRQHGTRGPDSQRNIFAGHAGRENDQ
ncbi:MAG: hypothetical protein KDH20_15850 [Rhodocyclaceae bacterium]|nr:hypothetical protein [Rhodocyclaceae bacterium]